VDYRSAKKKLRNGGVAKPEQFQRSLTKISTFDSVKTRAGTKEPGKWSESLKNGHLKKVWNELLKKISHVEVPK
jgi:hypothetical protein